MAITITPCNAAGEAIVRSSLTYSVYPGGLDVNAESTPHIKIVNDGDSAVTLNVECSIKDSFHNAYTGRYQKTYSVPANTTKVFAYQITFENLSTFQGYMRTLHTLSADMSISVRYIWTESGGTATLMWEDVTYHISGSEFKKWYEQRGFPRFDMDYTRLQRGTVNSSWVWSDSDTGTYVKCFGKIIVPAHFPFVAQVKIDAWERIGASTPTQKVSGVVVDHISVAQDYNAEQSSSGGSHWFGSMTGMLKVTYTLVWNAQFDTETIDTLTLYMSYIKPAIELDPYGTGVAFGKYTSGLGHLFEVSQDWDVEMPGNVSVGTLDANALASGLKQVIFNAVYPVGSYVFAQTQQMLAAIVNSYPGTWTISTYSFVMPRSDGMQEQLYFARRTG